MTRHDDASTFGDVLARFGDDGTKELFRKPLEEVVCGDAALREVASVRVGRVPPHLLVGRFDAESGSTGRSDDRRDLVGSDPRRDRHERGDVHPGVRDDTFEPLVTHSPSTGSARVWVAPAWSFHRPP